MSDLPLVSILTPVYNGAPYLEECIESVLGQTYENWDYTIVDNASTDETPEIASRYAAQDARIRHLRYDSFVSANANHNRAFRAANPASEFVKIVQADDRIYADCLTRMVAATLVSPAVGITSAYRSSEDGVDLIGLPPGQTIAAGRAILRKTLLEQPSVLGGPTSLLLRTAIVQETGTFYDERLWHADSEASFRILARHDFAHVHEVLSYERRQAGRQTDWSHWMNTIEAEGIRFLLMYGPIALAPREYRRHLRLRLRRYVRWHVRQFPRPSRLRSAEFFTYHQAQVNAILALGRGDREVQVAMRFVAALLMRKALGRHRRQPAKRGPAG
jgi:glycosyltransferase involved in cell wall biosynthesis